MALTAKEIPEDRYWLSAQGLSLKDLRRHMTSYRPHGKAIPGLPTDDYHRNLYRLRGWAFHKGQCRWAVDYGHIGHQVAG